MKKKFDSVKFMREVRDKMSRDMENMSPEDRLKYIQERASKVEEATKLRQKASQRR